MEYINVSSTMEFSDESTTAISSSIGKTDDSFLHDSGILSALDTGIVSQIGTSAPTVYGEYDDLDLLDYVEQNDFVGVDQNFGDSQMPIDDTSTLFDSIAENQACHLTEQENPIPNLINLICDEDLVVVHQAAKMILQLSKKEPSSAAIANNPEMFAALIQTVSDCKDAEIMRIVLNILFVVSWNEHTYRNSILRNPKIIPTLLRLSAISDDVKLKISLYEIIHKILSLRDICANVAANFPEFPSMLIHSASAANDADCTRKTLEILLKISQDKQGCISINNSKLLPTLVDWILRFINSDAIMSCALILYHLSGGKEPNKDVNTSDSGFSSTASSITGSSVADKESSLIFNNHNICVALVRILSTTNDFETIRAAASTLHNLSHTSQGRENICKYGGIPALINCLGTSSIALAAIHNLLLFKKGSDIAICEAGGLQKMIYLLRKDNAKFLTILADCLYSLAFGNDQNKLTILSLNGPAELVRILRTYNYEKLLWNTSKVLKVLSACSSNKKAIVLAGGMQALAMHLDYAKVASVRLARTALWTLRNLSDAATDIEGVEELLYAVVQFLNFRDEYIVMCAAGILCNLTCNNQNNKLTVCRAGGIEALVRTINVAGNCEDVTEPAVCALRHITSRHREAEAAQNEVRACFGIGSVMGLLRPTSGWPLIKAIIGLLRNMALCQANHEALREHSAIQHLGSLLKFGINEMRNQKNSGTVGTPLEGGIRLEEIVEVTIGALQTLSRDPQNRGIVHSEQIIPLLNDLMICNNESLRKLAADVLWEFG